MSDEQHELRRVNWKELFPWTNIFKSFRMAIQPSKLALAAATVILVALLGWAMDRVSYGIFGTTVAESEIPQYAAGSPAAFRAFREGFEQGRVGAAEGLWADSLEQRVRLTKYRAKLGDAAGEPHFMGAFDTIANVEKIEDKRPPAEEMRKKADSSVSDALAEAKKSFGSEVDRIERILGKVDDSKDPNGAWKRIENDKLDDAGKVKARENLAKAIDSAWRALTQRKIEFDRGVLAVRGRAVFDSLVDFESQCVARGLQAAASGNIGGGLMAYRQMLQNRAENLQVEATAQPVGAVVLGQAESPGFLYYTLMALSGLGWFFCQHWLFAILFLAGALAIWALLGGAMHRMSALQFARDEKLSAPAALKFALGKFLSFYTAPLIPLGIVLVIGLFMIVGGLMLSVPVLDIIMSILMPLAILCGLLAAFLLLGLIGGGSLMYPTIAVESSDSFDAISRSYSYVFAKPWRAAWYMLVALVYGAITYLFVRLFAYLALAVSHFFVGVGTIGGGQRLSPTADKLDVLWPRPTFDNLLPGGPWAEPGAAMTTWESICAFFIWITVAIVAAVVIGFLLSFLSSASTVIYFLLRREVDATDLDDIYFEEQPEEAEPAAGATAIPVETSPAPAAAAPEAPAAETPPAPAPPAAPSASVEPAPSEPPKEPPVV